MASISVIHWHEDPVGFTAWDSNVNSETKRRLKRAVNASPELLKHYLRQIRGRELLTIVDVKNEAVAEICQILETQGAEVLVAHGRSV